MADEDKPWLNTPIIRSAVSDNIPPSDDQRATTGRSVAKNVAAGAVEGGTSLLNIATDPFGTVIGPVIAKIGGTLYDAGAHLFGYPAMSAEQRADLYGQPQPGQTTRTPSAEQPLATRVVNAIDQAIPGQKAARRPGQHSSRADRPKGDRRSSGWWGWRRWAGHSLCGWRIDGGCRRPRCAGLAKARGRIAGEYGW